MTKNIEDMIVIVEPRMAEDSLYDIMKDCYVESAITGKPHLINSYTLPRQVGKTHTLIQFAINNDCKIIYKTLEQAKMVNQVRAQKKIAVSSSIRNFEGQSGKFITDLTYSGKDNVELFSETLRYAMLTGYGLDGTKTGLVGGFINIGTDFRNSKYDIVMSYNLKKEITVK